MCSQRPGGLALSDCDLDSRKEVDQVTGSEGASYQIVFIVSMMFLPFLQVKEIQSGILQHLKLIFLKEVTSK